jgi:putative spermidine/putrescine transport system permease protein
MAGKVNEMSISLKKTATGEAFQVQQKKYSLRVGLDKVILFLVGIYFLVPLVVTLAFGLSEGSGFTLQAFGAVFTDPDFTGTLLLSLELAVTSTILTIVIVTPTAYWVQLRLPQARALMNILSLVPFAVPAIVMAFGLIEVYSNANNLINVLSLGLVPLLSNNPFNIVNTSPLLVCGYVIIALPFVYRPIDNSLQAINTRVLSEAAASLGCGWWRTFLTIVLPNIWPGVTSAALLTFSMAMGEFTLASLFGLYTFPIYIDVTGQNDAHKAAAVTILSFLLTLLCVLGIALIPRLRRHGVAGSERMDLIAAK